MGANISCMAGALTIGSTMAQIAETLCGCTILKPVKSRDDSNTYQWTLDL